ncbi:hypothetical protein BD779DRAFT_1471386 [Infundibulicybe gibba]|nr:hypothetical protein BD779DRAFT_1471386 [Infundibulicybe gibba]
MSSSRLNMDAQRYDLSKRRSRSCMSVNTQATAGHNERGYFLPSGISDDSYTYIPPTRPNTPEIEAGSDLSHSTTAVASPPLSRASTSSATLEDESNSIGIHQVYAHDRGDFITTQTIIRPSPCISGVFSKIGSPLGLRFSTLNCLGNADAFEDDLDIIEVQRSKGLGIPEIKVFVTEEKSTYVEESWRGAVQAILYDNPAEALKYGVQTRVEVL